MTPESFHSEASADETHSQIGAACTVKGVAAEALVEEEAYRLSSRKRLIASSRNAALWGGHITSIFVRVRVRRIR